MIRKLSGTTAVITGATSGIGRETAREFAKTGAKVVLAGRRQERLMELAGEIEASGGQALAVRTDVADQAQVEALIEKSVERFGRVDVLVNNAGVAIASGFEAMPLEDFRRLMDVNFWGAVYACRAALPQMRNQRGGGVILNVSSIFGKRGMPFETAYCASKFALAGFSEALRAELMSEGIDVCTIYPGAVETEIFDAAANSTGFEVPGFVPKFPAGQMAKLIVQTARFPQPEVVAAFDAQAINIANTFAPALVDFALGWSVPFIEGMRRGKQKTDQSTTGSGNLYQPQAENKK
ncbi:MAG TPA: SDR family oxidoreductase [Blastocatellia bacterium]|jgi:NAD(P)-dependent dehydrogenase (short-subunit alcohol dehydrogenase family)